MKRYRVKTESVVTRYYLVDALNEDRASMSALVGYGYGQELSNQQEVSEEVIIEVTEEPDGD